MDIRQSMAVLLFLASALMAVVAVLAYRKRYLPVARTMILIMAAGTFYSLGYGFEVLSRNLTEVKLSLHIQYLGIPFITVLWLYQVIQFTGKAPRHRKRLAALLFVVPFAIFFLHLTNDWHGLVYERYVLSPAGQIPLYTTAKGVAYYLHALYSYAAVISGILLFIPAFWRAVPAVRKQIAVLLLGAVVPMLLNMVFWTGIAIDLTPFGFAISGAVYIWGIFRFNLLRLTPLAMVKVFETIREGVVLFDYEDRIVSYNKAAEDVLPELGQPLDYPVPMDAVLFESPELMERIGSAREGDERFAFRKSYGDRERHYTCSLSLVYDSGTVLIGKILLFNDITELKEGEARLLEQTKQLAELNAFKDKLFTVMAHDIRDPIALLVSLAELIGDEMAGADMEHGELLRELRDQAQGAFLLVDNLLDWYRGQRGAVVFRPASWNVKQVVRQALLLSAKRADMKRIRLLENIDEGLTVGADKDMLDLVLRNLLSNAIKYADTDSDVLIGAVAEGDKIILSVRDHGPGIDDKTAEWLRQEEPLFNIAAGGQSVDIRFGLALSREFIRIHGGTLWFNSAPGEGTTFRFAMPRSSGMEEMEDDAESEVAADESHFGGR